jgi:hypothetical protein
MGIGIDLDHVEAWLIFVQVLLGACWFLVFEEVDDEVAVLVKSDCAQYNVTDLELPSEVSEKVSDDQNLFHLACVSHVRAIVSQEFEVLDGHVHLFHGASHQSQVSESILGQSINEILVEHCRWTACDYKFESGGEIYRFKTMTVYCGSIESTV